MREWRYSSTILNLDIRLRWMNSFMPQHPVPGLQATSNIPVVAWWYEKGTMFLVWARDSLQGLTGLALTRGCLWRSLWITLKFWRCLAWFYSLIAVLHNMTYLYCYTSQLYYIIQCTTLHCNITPSIHSLLCLHMYLCIFRQYAVYFKLISHLFYSPSLKMYAKCPPETSDDFQPTTRSYIPEDGQFHNHRCENLISYKLYLVFPAINSTVAFLLAGHLHI
jgi:hypothetical protein